MVFGCSSGGASQGWLSNWSVKNRFPVDDLLSAVIEEFICLNIVDQEEKLFKAVCLEIEEANLIC